MTNKMKKLYYIVESTSGHCGGGNAVRLPARFTNAKDAIKATKDKQGSCVNKQVTYWFDWHWVAK